jgi:hypothetical protein
MTAKASSEDQRRFRRYAVNFPCVVKPRKKRKAVEGAELEAETQDVSSGGLFFLATSNWEIGTEIECELRLPVKAFGGRPIGILCRGKVARIVSKDGDRVGVGATIEHYEFFHVNNGERAQ